MKMQDGIDRLADLGNVKCETKPDGAKSYRVPANGWNLEIREFQGDVGFITTTRETEFPGQSRLGIFQDSMKQAIEFVTSHKQTGE